MSATISETNQEESVAIKVHAETQQEPHGGINGSSNNTAGNPPPVPGLRFTNEQDGYKYFIDPANQRQYCQDSVGFWYVYNESSSGFILCSGQPTVGVSVDEEGVKSANERFQRDAKGQFKLPLNDEEQVYFPSDESGNPIFPYDVVQKKWTFPIDDTDEPIFPRNTYNKPIVPLDEKGEAIFPKDPQDGTYIFPLDESHLPTTALTIDGRVVVPKDDSGEWVIPLDREGKPLIEISEDGIPMSRAEAANSQQWKKFYKQQQEQQAYFQLQQQQIANRASAAAHPASAIFHPLNLEQRKEKSAHPSTMIEKAKRTRPEDVDLPSHHSTTTEKGALTKAPASNGAQSKKTGGQAAATAGEDSAQAIADKSKDKRKALLTAQLHFSKKLASGTTTTTTSPHSSAIVGSGFSLRIGDVKRKEAAPLGEGLPSPKPRLEEKGPTEQPGGGVLNSGPKKQSPPPHEGAGPNESADHRVGYRRGKARSRFDSPPSRRRRRHSPSPSSSSYSSYTSYSSSRSSSRERSKRRKHRVPSPKVKGGESSRSESPIPYGPKEPPALATTTHVNNNNHSGLHNKDAAFGALEIARRRAEEMQRQMGMKKLEKKEAAEEMENNSRMKAIQPAAPVPQVLDDDSEIIFDIDELAQCSDIALVRRVIRQEQMKFEALKAQLEEMEKEKECYRANLLILYRTEKRIEASGGDMECDEDQQEYLSSSESERK